MLTTDLPADYAGRFRIAFPLQIYFSTSKDLETPWFNVIEHLISKAKCWQP